MKCEVIGIRPGLQGKYGSRRCPGLLFRFLATPEILRCERCSAASLLFAPRSFAKPDRQQQVLFGLLRHTAVSTAAKETGPVDLFFISHNGPIRSEGSGDAGVLQDALDRLRPIHPQRRHALARSWHTKPDLPDLFSIQQVLITSRMLRRLPKSHGLHVPKRVCAILATYYSHLLLFIHIFLGELFKKMLCEKEKTAFLLFFGIAFVEIETAPADLHHHMRRFLREKRDAKGFQNQRMTLPCA